VSLVPPRPSPLAPGFRLDRYELLCPIAEGGMASVWIARQRGKHGFQKLVAIKTILPKYAADPRFQQMFVDEARIASRIEHGNVTQILDVGEQHEVTYLVMEYVDGDALSKLHRTAVKKGAPLPLGVVLRMIADVCGGLHAAHELRDPGGQLLGVVHRDVSPQNVLVSTQGVAKLIDFGIAKARDRLSGDTNADQVKGKVQYMAPEQAIGKPVDRRADVWSAGAVLYHLLGGKPPFEADNDIQTLFLLSSGRPPPPLPANVPKAISDVVMRALAHPVEQRYPTAAALQQALEERLAAMDGGTTTAAVATYLASQVGDRAARRKETIALGLKAAEERERLAVVMRSNTDKTDTGTSEPRSVSSLVEAAPDSSGSASATPSVATSGTLGSAALSVEPAERSRGLRFALVGAVVGASLGVLALLAVIGSQRNASSARVAARPSPSAFVAPPLVSAVPAVAEPSASIAAAEPETSASSPPARQAPVAPLAPPAVPRTWWPGPRPATAPKPVRTRVNDGF